MIKRKINTCISCNKDKPIYARKMCGMCYQNDRARAYRERQKNKPRKRIKPISDKRAELLKRYRVKRDKFMGEHPFCEARLEGCGFRATDCHHKKKRRGDDLFNPEYFMALCRSCHNFIEDKMPMDEAVEKGFRIRSL